MTTYTVVDGTKEHSLRLRHILRPLDKREICGQGGHVRKIMWRTFNQSIFTRTALVDGEVVAMWGLGGTILSDEGHPWLLTAPAVERLPMAIVREARGAIWDMLELRSYLWNYVLADYTGAIRLLEVIGFAIDPPTSPWATGEKYRKFWLRR